MQTSRIPTIHLHRLETDRVVLQTPPVEHHYTPDQGDLSGPAIALTDPFVITLEKAPQPETAFLYSETNKAFIFSFITSENGGNLFVKRLLFMSSTAEQTDDPFLGQELILPATDSDGFLGGIVNSALIEALPELFPALYNPYLVQMNIASNQNTLYFFDHEQKRWMQLELETVNSQLIAESKIIASSNDTITNLMSRSRQRHRLIMAEDHTFHPTYFEPLKDKQPRYFPAVAAIVKEITKKTKSPPNLFEATRNYHNALTNLLKQAGIDLRQTINIPQFMDLFKKWMVGNKNPLGAILHELSTGSEFNNRAVEVFLRETLPRLLSVMSFTPIEADGNSTIWGLSQIAAQVGQGRIKIMSPLCPPYHYKVRNLEKNYINHADGQLLPTTGDRLPSVLEIIGRIFQPLTAIGVKIDIEFWTYSGETNNLADLVELGNDVKDYYRGSTSHIFNNLQMAFQELAQVSSKTLDQYGISTSTVSIEKYLAPSINAFVADFQAILGGVDATVFDNKGHDSSVVFSPAGADDAIGDYLQLTAGVRQHFLEHFCIEEWQYRKKQGIRTLPGDLIVAALREGMLYHALTARATNQRQTILVLEMTHDYMKAAVDHAPSPVIMTRGFDVRDPKNRLNLRQPFTNIEGLTDE